jgi:hypothetical protein
MGRNIKEFVEFRKVFKVSHDTCGMLGLFPVIS